MSSRPSINRLSRPSEQAPRFWGEITVPGVAEDRFDGQSRPDLSPEPGVSQRITDHRGRLHPGDVETWATRSNATSWIYGRPPTKSRQLPKERARSNDRYILPVGVAPPARGARLEDQIVCAMDTLGTATERQVLELIARDQAPLAHKMFMQMVASGAIVSASRKGTRLNQRRKVESQPLVVLEGILLSKRVASPVSTSAYVRSEPTSRLVKVVAFGSDARRLWHIAQGSALRVHGRWLKTERQPYFRIFDFAGQAADSAVEDRAHG